MQKIWFIYHNQLVSGPFSTDEVHDQIQLGKWTNTNCFIWWKGQREWMSIQQWQTQLSRILKKEEDKNQSPVWYIDAGANRLGPLTQKEMIENLRALDNINKVRLWSIGMDKWKNLFELHEIMDELGLSRRENDRAPLMGTVTITHALDQSSPMLAKAASISVAGMGVNDAPLLKKGEDVHLAIKSPEFRNLIRLQATTVYVTPQGYVGLSFKQVPPEVQALIHDYVSLFNSPDKFKRTG